MSSRKAETEQPASPSARRRRSKLRRTMVWLCILAVLAFIADATIYEPYHPILTTRHVAVPGLPASLDGFRVVQLSDLHRNGTRTDALIAKAVRMANSTHADLAVLTGDFVSVSARNAKPCCKLIKNLRTCYGSYAVLGNHEYWTNADEVSRALTDSGINLLTNRNVRLPNGLRLVGLDDEWSGHPDVEAAFKGTKAGEPTIILCHEPTGIERVKTKPVLVLCGHTHGATANIPGLVHIFAQYAHCDGYVSGWYRRDRALMYVNQGIGTDSAYPPFRFRNRPEVTLYVLHPTKRPRPYVMARSLD